ncbi:hypothetical protein [Vallitalea maricola]|uniref:Uncharacterized protein n=1 Tax=Vallitalea maricola TaxID=3074433 RepID=A0ACB5UFY7_9FIRM|nr:hypothetical protein AN2V17_07490 [Vallitalea sp. AN17-2]
MKKRILSLMVILGILSLGLPTLAQDDYKESENNNSMSRADRFYARAENAVVEGDFYKKGDRDYFKLYADETGIMKIKFRYDGDPEIRIKIFNSDKEVIYDEKEVAHYFNYKHELEEDDYIYVCVDHCKGSYDGDYRLYFKIV